MTSIVNTVEDSIQNSILTAIDSIVAPIMELAIRSINAVPGQDATNFTAISELGEQVWMTAPFENVSERNTPHVLTVNDETRNNNQDKVSELSVPGTHSDRLPHIRHSSKQCS